jgi:hypothetical protein
LGGVGGGLLGGFFLSDVCGFFVLLVGVYWLYVFCFVLLEVGVGGLGVFGDCGVYSWFWVFL